MADLIIATEEEAKSIGGGGSADITANKMCTKQRALDLNCKVSGTYATNLLVPLSVLTKSTIWMNINAKNLNTNLQIRVNNSQNQCTVYVNAGLSFTNIPYNTIEIKNSGTTSAYFKLTPSNSAIYNLCSYSGCSISSSGIYGTLLSGGSAYIRWNSTPSYIVTFTAYQS